LKRFDRSTSHTTGESDASNDKGTLTLVFQTLEHRMKKLREKALEKKYVRSRSRGSTSVSSKRRSDVVNHKDTAKINDTHSSARLSRRVSEGERAWNREVEEDSIQVTMKHLNQSIFVLVHRPNTHVPYRVENRSLKHIIYFRQRGCEQHKWISLPPGDSVDYVWEEPMKPHKLTVRVGSQRKTIDDKSATPRKFMRFNIIESEDQEGGFGAARTVKLDEIGFHELLPCPGKPEAKAKRIEDTGNISCEAGAYLHCRVDTKGKTRMLIISEHEDSKASGELGQLESHLEIFKKQIFEESLKLKELMNRKSLRDAKSLSVTETKFEDGADVHMSSSLPTVKEDEIALDTYEAADGIEDSEREVVLNETEKAIINVADVPEGEAITSRHQVLVEVVEATGLCHQIDSELSDRCNPYCTLRVIRRSRRHRPNIFAAKSDTNKVHRTYYIEKTVSPKWSGMKFIFDVSHEAEKDPQGYSILVKVKDFRRVGKNGSLGMSEIRLRNLKHQKEVFGWFPLMARTGRGSDILAAGAGRGRGSVKLRVQWIYKVSALVNYYIILLENRLGELRSNCEGMKAQIENLRKDELIEKEMAESLSKLPIFNTTSKNSVSLVKQNNNKSWGKRRQKSRMSNVFTSNDSTKRHNSLSALSTTSLNGRRKHIFSSKKVDLSN